MMSWKPHGFTKLLDGERPQGDVLAALLIAISILLALAGTVLLLLNPLSNGTTTYIAGGRTLILCLVLLQFAIIWLVRDGHLRVGGALNILLLWGVLAYAGYLTGGIYATTNLLFIIPIFLTVIVLGDRAAATLLMATFFYFCGLVVIELAGLLPPGPPRDLPYRLVMLSLLFFFLTSLFIVLLRVLVAAERANATLRLESERLQIYERLAGNLAHDLRTPLSILKTRTWLARRSVERGANPLDHLDTLDNYLGELSGMFDDFFMLTQLNAQTRQTIRNASHDIDTRILIERAVGRIREQAQQRDIRVQVLLPEGDLPHLWGQSELMMQALHALLSNAVQFGKPGGFVRVAVERVPAGSLCIHVTDDGVGIESEHMGRIFEPFYRADPARTMGERVSSGMGLAIAQRVIDLHGGRLSVRSQPGHGATFSMELPLHGQRALSHLPQRLPPQPDAASA